MQHVDGLSLLTRERETPQSLALLAAELWLDDLRTLARVPPRHASSLIGMLRERRMYVLQRDPERFKDVLYHLLDRDYLPWRGHVIAVTPDELRHAFPHGSLPRGWHDEDRILMIMADDYVWKSRKKPYLLSQIELVAAIVNVLAAQERAAKAGVVCNEAN